MKSDNLIGYIFIAPWIIGFILFHGGPIIAAFGLSFYNWSLLSAPSFAGLDNYSRLISDPLFYQSLKVTLIFTFGTVPLQLSIALIMAILLNQKVKGMGIFRTIFYLPTVVTGVAIAILWSWVYNPEYGLLNQMLGWIGIEGPAWLFSQTWALPAIIIMMGWTFGGAMVIFLAGLQDIPQHLYESADIDGASSFRKFYHITLPMISPVVLFNAVMGVIGSFQVFTHAFIMTEGGPNNATLMLVLYIYEHGFQHFNMGYAATLALVLFAVVLIITLLQFKLSHNYVHYER